MSYVFKFYHKVENSNKLLKDETRLSLYHEIGS